MPGHTTNHMKGPRVATAEDEDEAYGKTARALLKLHKFELDDVNKEKDGWTTMNLFSSIGNFKMCRYLFYSCGADCRKTIATGYFPMYYAALYGHLEIVLFLYHECGAHNDIREVTVDGWSPLRIALHNGHFHVIYWLILVGALAPRNDVDGGGIDNMLMRRELRDETGRNWRADKRLPILSWAQDAVATHANVVQLLLTGTIARNNQMPTSLFRRHPNNPYTTRSKGISPSPLVMFKGKSGILELIAHYVAGTKQQLRTLRQLTDRLPAFIADVPFVIDEDE